MKINRQAAFVFLVCFAVFYGSPARWLADSRHALLLSESLLRYGMASLENYFPSPPPSTSPAVAWNDVAGVRYDNGHLYYLFPPGGSLLAVPLVAVFNAAGFHVIGPDGLYDATMELAMQAFIASLLMAGLCVGWFAMASRLLPPRLSALFAFACAFATPVWSSASRVLWADSWGIALLTLSLWFLVQSTTSRSRSLLQVLLLAMLVAVKPTYMISALGIAAYSLGSRRSARRLILIAVGGAGLAVTAYGLASVFHILPAYYWVGRLSVSGFGQGLAGVLFSPGRGLFLYVPVLWLVAWLLVRHWTALPNRPLVILALVVTALDVAVVACFPRWSGGQCFGPRLLVGALPWLMFIGLATTAAAVNAPTSGRARAGEFLAAVVLVAVGVALHGRGALSPAPMRWNYEPANVDAFPSRLWDWRVPPFLADLVPDRLLPGAPLYLTSDGARSFLGPGWSGYGGPLGMQPAAMRAAGIPADEDMLRDWRWTDGSDSIVRLHSTDVRDRRITLTVIPFLVPGQLTEQLVGIYLDDRLVREARLTVMRPTRLTVDMPGDVSGCMAELRLHLPNAARPAALGLGSDSRSLGLMVLKIEAQ